ncbi:MAG: hypothetical protein ABSB00_02120 [Minisyncoccia bacterium]|jgi:hypothetical protein
MDTIDGFSITNSVRQDAVWGEKRLRKERRCRTIVVVRIVDPVRVELEPAVVEVEDRRVRELGLVARRLPSPVRGTGA